MCHDHQVLVDEVVRRNRRRIALLTVVAIVNYMIMAAALVSILCLINAMFRSSTTSSTS